MPVTPSSASAFQIPRSFGHGSSRSSRTRSIGTWSAQEAAHGVIQQHLIFGESEIHAASFLLSGLGRLGLARHARARVRAMMFFWICAVPPPMIRPSEKIECACQKPWSRSYLEWS